MYVIFVLGVTKGTWYFEVIVFQNMYIYRLLLNYEKFMVRNKQQIYF